MPTGTSKHRRVPSRSTIVRETVGVPGGGGGRRVAAGAAKGRGHRRRLPNRRRVACGAATTAQPQGGDEALGIARSSSAATCQTGEGGGLGGGARCGGPTARLPPAASDMRRARAKKGRPQGTGVWLTGCPSEQRKADHGMQQQRVKGPEAMV